MASVNENVNKFLFRESLLCTDGTQIYEQICSAWKQAYSKDAKHQTFHFLGIIIRTVNSLNREKKNLFLVYPVYEKWEPEVHEVGFYQKKTMINIC